MIKLLKLVSLAFIFFSQIIHADDKYAYGGHAYNKCSKVVEEMKPGDLIKVEMKLEKGKYVYEFDIRDEENIDWDIECAADTAKVIEIEQESFGINDQKFLTRMVIDLKQAKSVALTKYPGEIIEIEYEIEENGQAVYEFDIKTNNGKEMKVEIDATTGAIHEETEEIWQFGYE